MPLNHEFAKNAITAFQDKTNGEFTVEWFFPSTAWGFMMHAKWKPNGYDKLIEMLTGLGLEPDLHRVKKTDSAWYYEIMVEVPDDWKAPEA